MSDMIPKKAFILVVFNINQTFWFFFFNLQGNSIYLLPDNRLKTRIFTYSLFTDSITQQDPALIHLSILLKKILKRS